MRRQSPGVGLAAHLLLACLFAIAPLHAQDIPSPCDNARRPDIRDRCITLEQAVADSQLAVLLRYAASLGAPQLDSAIRAQPKPPTAWSSLAPGIRALLEARFKLEITRYDLEWYAAAQDPAVVAVAPVDARFRRDRGGRGLQAVLSMYSASQTNPAITFYSPMRDEHRMIDIPLQPSSSRDYGWQQGWTFVSGDMVESRANGFRPHLIIAP